MIALLKERQGEGGKRGSNFLERVGRAGGEGDWGGTYARKEVFPIVNVILMF